MEPFTVYYKMCSGGPVEEDIAIGFFTAGEGGVHFQDGGWNPIQDTYLTKEQAERHWCRCVSCRASRLPDKREDQSCPSCQQTEETVKELKRFLKDVL